MKSPLAFVVALTLTLGTFAYEWEKGPVRKAGYGSDPSPCPGVYCGRQDLNATHYSGCGKCDRGWRVGNNTHSLCQKCEGFPEKNDWFFLAFHVTAVMVLQLVAVDLAAGPRRTFTAAILVLHACAVFEVTGAAVITILIMEPAGKLTLTSCRVTRIHDWYTFFQNPTPNFSQLVNCSQEAVYPLYTMVFIFHGLCAILMLLFRPLLSSKVLPGRGRKAVYAALYFLPSLSLIHAVAGGLVYASYQYIVLISSLISLAFHFGIQLDQSPRGLLLTCFKDPRRMVILLGHWILHGFGVLSITQLTDMTRDLSLLALVPVPALFYILTSKFTAITKETR